MNLTINHLEGIASILDTLKEIKRVLPIAIKIDAEENIYNTKELEELEALCLSIQETTEQYDLPLLSVYDHLINWQTDEANNGDYVPTKELIKEVEEYINSFKFSDGEITATEYIIHRFKKFRKFRRQIFKVIC